MTTQVNEEIASKIVQWQGRAPVDVVGLANDIGINVWEAALGTKVSGQLLKDPKNGGKTGYSILVNAKEPYVRRRFTVAHELAHFLLHREMVRRLETLTEDTFYRAEGLNSWHELEANHFAALILMPDLLVKRFKAEGRSLIEMADLLEVSEPAMRIRLSLQDAPMRAF
jgi:Zn-dependent peptidase ImmA (M78 family)